MPLDGGYVPQVADAPDVGPFDLVGKALIGTRNLVNRSWARNSLQRGRQAVCILGAIKLTTHSDYPYSLPHAEDIYEWNDNAEGRAEVVALIDAAIADPGRPKWRWSRKGLAAGCTISIARQLV